MWTGRITELKTGTAGILCGLTVEWTEGDSRAEDSLSLFCVYVVRKGQIYQIRRFGDREFVAEAASITA